MNLEIGCENASAYTPHAPIYINGNAEFTAVNGVSNPAAAGTAVDPYIIEGWDINASTAHGIYITNTDAYFVVRDCYVHDGETNWYDGIWLSNVINGKIENSNITHNWVGISLSGSSSNIVSNNSIHSNDLRGMSIGTCSSNTINNNSIHSNNRDGGIYMYSVSINNIISNNSIHSNTGNGILIEGSDGNTIFNNSIYSNTALGIWLKQGSDKTTITNNSVYSNDDSGIGFYGGQNHTVSNNSIFSNYFHGLSLFWWAINHTIYNNNIYSNGFHGISIHSNCNDNLIFNNDITNNTEYAINITSSNNCYIYHNNFLYNHGSSDTYNPANVQTYDDAINYWNDSYPFGGNYWRDYNGVDLNSTAAQNAPPPDGIGDTPYVIDLNSQDNYPFMEMSGWKRVQNLNTGVWYINIQTAIDDANHGETLWASNRIYHENVVVNKTLTIIGEDWETTVINGGGSGDVVRVTADWVNITGFTVTYGGSISGDSGIELDNVQYCSVTNCNVSENSNAGILLNHSTSNIIANNKASYNNFSGIEIRNSSSNTISDNTMVNDGIFLWGETLAHWNTQTISTSNSVNGKPVYYWKDQTGGTVPLGAGEVILANCTDVIVENQNVSNGSTGIELGFSSKITIANNTALSNKIFGFYLYSSIDNNISGNILGLSDLCGLYLNTSCNNNSISGNTISDNTYGICLFGSSSNLIYHNDIIDNVNQAYDDGINLWNLTYPFGGNYWDDYTGSDFFSGPNQDIMGSDGFGDTPYGISGGSNAKDHYPYTGPMKTPSGDIIITSHTDGEYVNGIILIEAAATFGDILGVKFYIDGTPKFSDGSYPYQYVLDTTSLPEDEVFEVKAEAILQYNVPVNTTITLIANNYVDTGDYIIVSTGKSEYQPDQDVSVLVDMISPPWFNTVDIIVNCTDSNGNTRYASEYSLPYDSNYQLSLSLNSDAPQGLYVVTARGLGYIDGVLVWEATNVTTFMVSGESLQRQLENISGSLDDLQSDIAYMNQTLPSQIYNLSSQLSGVNDSLMSVISTVEGNLLADLQGVNASLAADIQDLLTSITNDLILMNSSLSDQLMDLLDNMTIDNDALRSWLEIVLDQIDGNVTDTKKTLAQQLNDLNTTMQTFHNEILDDLMGVYDSLFWLESNLSVQHSTITSTIDTLNNTIAGALGLSTGEILDKINESIAMLSALDSNVTTYSSNIQDLQAQLIGLVQNQGNMTRDQLLENITEILGEMQSLDAEIASHDDDVKENLTTLQDLIDNIGTMDISEIMGALSDLEGTLTTIDSSMAQDIEDVEVAVKDFQTEIQGDLDAINTTLDELEKLQDIIDDLAALDTALAQGNEELKADIDEIPTEKKEEEGFGLAEGLLIIVILLLLINLLLMITGRGKPEEAGPKALPDEEEGEEDFEDEGEEDREEPEEEEEWEEEI